MLRKSTQRCQPGIQAASQALYKSQSNPFKSPMSHSRFPSAALSYYRQIDDFMANLHAFLIKQATHKCQPMQIEMRSSSKSDESHHNLGLKQKGKMVKGGERAKKSANRKALTLAYLNEVNVNHLQM